MCSRNYRIKNRNIYGIFFVLFDFLNFFYVYYNYYLKLDNLCWFELRILRIKVRFELEDKCKVRIDVKNKVGIRIKISSESKKRSLIIV